MRRSLYGVAEIAEALGEPREKVSVWRGRGHLPPASEELACGPIWTASAIEPWIRARRRHAGEPIAERVA